MSSQAAAVPVPKALNIRHGNVSENWKHFETAWTFYEIASGFDKKSDKVRVAALLSIIGQEAVELYQAFEWKADEEQYILDEVLKQFKAYCIPRANVSFETYRFGTTKQEPDESIDVYVTALRKLASPCEFGDKERIRDQVVIGIRDNSVRERILRSPNPDLSKVLEVIRASEASERQSKEIMEEKIYTKEVNKVNKFTQNPSSTGQKGKNVPKPNTDDTVVYKCNRCGGSHAKRECPAWGQECHKCEGRNHFAKCCKSKRTTKEADNKQVTVEKQIYSITSQSKTKTFKLHGSRKKITFQIDTGAELNVLPFPTYVDITGDKNANHLTDDNITLISYGGQRSKSKGSSKIKILHNGQCHTIQVTVADVDASPLLGRATSEKLKLVKFMDCDQYSSVNVVNENKDNSIIKKYQDVFTGIGKLEGEYKITVNDTIGPVIHAPRRVPVAIRDELKELLSQMETDGVITKVTKPTQWVSSLMLKREPNKLRICLDPQDLNKAVQREHHPLPTVEEVATRQQGARIFSVLDVKRGFWHVVLEEESSYLTTFNTTFGRYRWLRMPFGISSAPEVFQRKMMEFAEDLHGVEVVADDFLIIGFGDTDEEADKDHDKNLTAFLEKARKKNPKLNGDKMKLKLTEVPFIGHVLSKEGLRVDPKKVEAIKKMPFPKDETALKRFLGMVVYLSKFLLRLTEMTKPLRELLNEDSPWTWTTVHHQSFEEIKEAISNAPILVYYDVTKEVTIQCDAGQSGLGGVLLQEGKPVAFTSRAMTKTEERYAQIEKEMLAILHSCIMFEQFVYGRAKVTVETDHKPLETILRKSIDSCPRRLQRMLLALQKYSLDVKYKRGKELYVADTLSRAFLDTKESTKDYDILELRELQEATRLQEISAVAEIPNCNKRTEEIRKSTKEDTLLQEVIKYVREGWPEDRKKIPIEVKPYHDVRDELIEEDGILFKGTRVVIPRAQRSEVMKNLHSSHMGIESTLRLAREYVYWPNMNSQLKDKITRCEICNQFRIGKQKETLKSHEVPARAWCAVSADLFEFRKEIFLIVVDQYSNYFEYQRISPMNAYNVVLCMKSIFSRFGILEKVMTDNGRQFTSNEFQQFAETYGFDHVTSSPRYPQSNGKAENAVKTCKMLMKKAVEGKGDFFLALLVYRNTPQAEIGVSPAQRMFGRRTRFTLPAAPGKYEPEALPQIKEKIEKAREKQKLYYDKGAKDLEELKAGDTIRMKLPGCERWSKGICVRKRSERSYLVKVNGAMYVRNRRQLIKTPEANPTNISQDEELQEPSEPRQTLRRSQRRRRKPARLGTD